MKTVYISDFAISVVFYGLLKREQNLNYSWFL